jgi:hypothetical protein
MFRRLENDLCVYAKHKFALALRGAAKASALNKWSGDNFIDSGTLPLPNNKIKVEKRAAAAAIALRVCLAAGANPPAAASHDSICIRARVATGSVEGECYREFPADKR